MLCWCWLLQSMMMMWMWQPKRVLAPAISISGIIAIAVVVVVGRGKNNPGRVTRRWPQQRRSMRMRWGKWSNRGGRYDDKSDGRCWWPDHDCIVPTRHALAIFMLVIPTVSFSWCRSIASSIHPAKSKDEVPRYKRFDSFIGLMEKIFADNMNILLCGDGQAASSWSL